MKQSQAGKKLNPMIANLTAPIYAHDPVRYQRLCQWVWTQQKQGWPDEAIAKALDLAGQNIHLAGNWWSYLSTLLPKAKGKAAEAESFEFKSEVGAIAAEFVEFFKQRKAR